MTIRTLLAWATCLLPGFSLAETVQVAVAANFTQPMERLAADFRQATGHVARLSFGSSGKLVAQMLHGAPFEVFLSADQDKPQTLVAAGLAEAGSQFTYATGRLVLWSANPELIGDDATVTLRQADFRHLAIAEPQLAPYGAAAVQALKSLTLYDRVESRLVRGENIAQTYQFVFTGNAELGFVAASQVLQDGKLSRGSGWLVPAALHQPIHQDAILLQRGTDNPAALALIDYLHSDAATALIRQFGYDSGN